MELCKQPGQGLAAGSHHYDGSEKPQPVWRGWSERGEDRWAVPLDWQPAPSRLGHVVIRQDFQVSLQAPWEVLSRETTF